MHAKVIDVTDQTVYLEIENQLRFRSGYHICKPGDQLAPQDEVEFDFNVGDRGGAVVINSIHGRTGGRVSRENSRLP